MESLVLYFCFSSPFTEAVSVKLIIISTANPENNSVDCKKKIDLSLMSAFFHLLTLLQQKQKCLSLWRKKKQKTKKQIKHAC
jgi:hypothetical protein